MPALLPAGAGARVPAFTPVPKPWFSQNDVNKDKYHLHTQWMCYRRGFLKLKRSDLVIGNKPGWNFAQKEYIYYTAAAKSLQSCPTLRDPIDGSPPGSPVPGTLQARTLEWVAISFSNAWKWKVKGKSCLTLSDPMDCSLPGSSIHGIFQARVLEWDAIAFFVGSLKDSSHGLPSGIILFVWFLFGDRF